MEQLTSNRGDSSGRTVEFDHLLDGLGSGRDRLCRSLDRTDRGFDRDLRTPLYEGANREEILDLLSGKIGPAPYEELEGIDQHEREKVGPLSIMLPYAERRESVLKYWKQDFNPDMSCFEAAVSKVCGLIPAGSLRLDSFREAYRMMPKDTSLGLPYLTRDKQYAASYLARAQEVSSPGQIYPCVLYWRGQSAGLREVPKQRVVWGFDHAETIIGATVLYPVLNVLKRLQGFSAWVGDVAVDRAMTRIIRKAQGRRIISMDYSGFDSSLARPMLDAVDSILCVWFQDPGPDRIRLLGEVSATIPLVVPYDVLDGRNGGMPSGSVLTNLRDTIANLIAGFYAGIRLQSELLDYEVLGDDSVFLFANDMDPEALSRAVSELGLESNPSKQFVSLYSAHFLQRWHSSEHERQHLFVGVRSPYRAMSGMLGYERFRNDWSKWMDSSRWIMQVENVRHDPRFRPFVAFLKYGDKVLLSGIDPVEVFRRAGGSEMIRSVLSIASFPFNVQNPDRVKEFETTRVLRELG